MYDNKTQAKKDALYTARSIFLMLAFFALMLAVFNKNKAITYMLIDFSPKSVVADYVGSRKIHEHMTERSYLYISEKNNRHQYDVRVTKRYLKEFLEKNGTNKVNLLYSEFFPSVSYMENEISDIKSDSTVFLFGSLMFILFFSLSAFFTIKIFKFNDDIYA